MIEELLIQYGTLGLWVAYMVYKERSYMKDMKLALAKNTSTLEDLSDVIALIHPEAKRGKK